MRNKIEQIMNTIAEARISVLSGAKIRWSAE
jgi:hypothetical protein